MSETTKIDEKSRFFSNFPKESKFSISTGSSQIRRIWCFKNTSKSTEKSHISRFYKSRTGAVAGHGFLPNYQQIKQRRSKAKCNRFKIKSKFTWKTHYKIQIFQNLPLPGIVAKIHDFPLISCFYKKSLFFKYFKNPRFSRKTDKTTKNRGFGGPF